MLEQYKDVEVGGRKFRIGRVTAAAGNWIALQIPAGKSIEFDTYQRIERFLFENVEEYKEAGIIAKAWAGGQWLDPQVRYDLDIVNTLYRACMDFNFGEFFKKRQAEWEADEKAARLAANQGTPQ